MKPANDKAGLFASLLLTMSLLVLPSGIHAQPVTAERLQALAPDEQDLQGFVRVRPAGEEIPDREFSEESQTWVQPVSVATVIKDKIQINAQKPTSGPLWQPGKTCSRVVRTLYSENGLYRLDMTITVYDTPLDAQEDLVCYKRGLSVPLEKGSLTSPRIIGDESWTDLRSQPQRDRFNTLTFRQGRTVVFLQGTRSRIAAPSINFPPAAVEAVAYQIQLRAAQQPELTGVSVQQAHVDVDGHALPKNALQLAGQTYVPVAEFTKAMGMASHWDTKTGVLTFSGAGHKSVALTAGSTAAMIDGTKAAALSVPVLKQNGEPVMTLADLLAVTGGRIVGHDGNTVQVKG